MKSLQKTNNKITYEAPAIIYEGQLTARAGSLSPDIGGAPGTNNGGADTGIVNPGDLFGNG